MPVRSSGFVGRGWAAFAALAFTLAASAAQAATPLHAGEKAAFPPFDVKTFTGQVFWLVISFGVLYWLMSRVALPRLGSILEERSATIARDLDHASQMQAKAEETAQAYEKALTEARGNAQSIAQSARESGAKASDERRHAVEADLATKLAASESTIADTKAKAMANVRDLGSDIAIAIVTKLGGQAPSASEASEAVDKVLTQG